MRTLLLGCGAILLIVVIGVGWVGWKGYTMVRQFGEGFEQVQLAYDHTDDQFPFNEPTDEVPSPEQLDRWLLVRQRMVEPVASFHLRLEQLEQNQVSVSVSGVADIIQLPITLGQEHVAALEAAGMSRREYTWIFNMVQATLVSDEARADPQLAALVNGMEQDFNEIVDIAEAHADEPEAGVEQASYETPMIGSEVEVTPAQRAALLPLLRQRLPQLEQTSRVILLDAIMLGLDGESGMAPPAGEAAPAQAEPLPN